MQRLVAMVALSTFLYGCATEQDRYQWNLTHAFVCPKARRLSPSDLDQIARALAHATRQVAVQIGPPAGADPMQRLFVLTAYRGAEQSESRDSYGACELRKESDGWHIVDCATDLSPSLWHMMGCL